MTVVRWTFSEYEQPSVSWTVPINPNDGGALGVQKNITVQSNTGPNRLILLQEGQSGIPTMPFSGAILTQQHYETFERWYAKRKLLTLTDDLGRTYVGILSAWAPTRVRRASNVWYHTYTAEFQANSYVNASGDSIYGRRL